MRTALIIFVLAAAAFSQNRPNAPMQATVTLNGASGCAPYTVACVSTVNGRAVCPYGRVAGMPIPAKGNWPGQPYTVFTYPKTDQSGKPIDLYSPTGCVWTLPSANHFDPNVDFEGGHF